MLSGAADSSQGAKDIRATWTGPTDDSCPSVRAVGLPKPQTACIAHDLLLCARIFRQLGCPVHDPAEVARLLSGGDWAQESRLLPCGRLHIGRADAGQQRLALRLQLVHRAADHVPDLARKYHLLRPQVQARLQGSPMSA